MTKCPPIYGRSIVAKKETEKGRKVEKRIRAIGKSERDKWKMSIEEKFDDEINSQNWSSISRVMVQMKFVIFYAKEGKDISNVERRERGGKRIHKETIEERVH